MYIGLNVDSSGELDLVSICTAYEDCEKETIRYANNKRKWKVIKYDPEHVIRFRKELSNWADWCGIRDKEELITEIMNLLRSRI